MEGEESVGLGYMLWTARTCLLSIDSIYNKQQVLCQHFGTAWRGDFSPAFSPWQLATSHKSFCSGFNKVVISKLSLILSPSQRRISMELNNEILDYFVFCKYRAYLRKNGQIGIESDYELIEKKRHDLIHSYCLKWAPRIKEQNSSLLGQITLLTERKIFCLTSQTFLSMTQI